MDMDMEPSMEEQVETALAALRNEEQEEQLQQAIKKKYRATQYDIHDETYANTLRNIESDNEAFNTFTENLMAEPKINRYSLLKAIDDYNEDPASKLSPLSERFMDEAFNCRPYQACIICWICKNNKKFFLTRLYYTLSVHYCKNDVLFTRYDYTCFYFVNGAHYCRHL